jgi:phenylacetate-coenzyme A ligase PaaK-like adenylate-forming protein
LNNLFHPANLESRILEFNTQDPGVFLLELFRFQYQNNTIYQEYANRVGATPDKVTHWKGIPFLPISFFKTHQVKTTDFEPEFIFTSSGTTGSVTSGHPVKKLSLYEESFNRGFLHFYGDPSGYCILGLLPSYLERAGSSLVYMTEKLIKQSGHPLSGLYLYDFDLLARNLQKLKEENQKVILLGVTFALLDFAEAYPMSLEPMIVMETGGMKGRKKEMTRQEVHSILKQRLGISAVHSEYGMTELLSQAYSKGDGLFECPPWMKICLRDEDDPLSLMETGQKKLTGAINVIDLYNIYSCSFIATEDVGRIYPDGKFEILGRMDHSDIRGCSLLTV